MGIEMKEITFGYVPENPILKGISFSMDEGVVGILGHSGSGKSTTIRIISGLLRPDQGDVYVDGKPVWGSSVTARRDIQRRIGVVFQHGALFDFLTIGGNLEFALRALKVPKEEWAERIGTALKRVGLGGDPRLLGRWVTEVSGGQMRRIGLARVLVTRPEIILFDEPTTGLDPRRTRDVVEVVKESLKASNLAVIVSHDIRFIREVCTSAILLEGGKITSRIDQRGIDRLFARPFVSGGDPNLLAMHDFIEGFGDDDDEEEEGSRPEAATYNVEAAFTDPA